MGAPYIYDISHLRVNNLTLILLTWRKWWAPNSASKKQMGFNSGFKELNRMDCIQFSVAPQVSSVCVQHTNIWACCRNGFSLYRVYLKCLDNLQEWIPHTKTRNTVHIRPQTFNFEGTTRTFALPRSFSFLSVVRQLQLKIKNTSPTHFWFPINHS